MRKIITPKLKELCLKLITLFDLKAFRRMGMLPIISVMPNMKHMQLDFTINKKSSLSSIIKKVVIVPFLI
jgi:hypothetical protein